MDERKTAPSAGGVVLSVASVDLAVRALEACEEFGLLDLDETLRARDELLNLGMIAREDDRVVLAVRP
jgi:hypothetical protein